MKKILILLSFTIWLLAIRANAQGNQTVSNGAATSTVNFAGAGCIYNWVNDNPAIGLAANGSGSIPSFSAVNTGNVPIVATVKATPLTGGFAYISNVYANSVSVISVAENKVIATIPVPGGPIGVGISPDGTKVYVVNSIAGSVSVINTLTYTIIKNIGVSGYSYGLCVSPDGSRVYVTNYNNKTVGVINTATNTLIANVPAGPGPYNVCISPDGNFLYVTNNDVDATGPGTVTVINTITNAIVSQITVGNAPDGITINKDGSRVYVTNSQSNTVSVINTATNTNVATITVGYYPRGIAISPDGRKMFTKDGTTKRLMITDLSNNTSTLSGLAGSGTIGLALTSDGLFAYVENQVDNNVTVINTTTNAVVANISVQTAPQSVGNFISANVACSDITFTITVNPNPNISIGNITGTIISCYGSTSTSPNIEQFSVDGTYLTNNIVVTAPAGFEVSLSANAGYSNNISITPANGSITNGVIYIRSSALAATGNNTGDITLTSTGAESKTITATSTINALPVINPIASQEVKTGTDITPVNFTGTAYSYTWKNSLPQIGLTATGIGNIPAFTAINNGNTALKAIIIVTPVNSTGCAGDTSSFNITVDPTQPTLPTQPAVINIVIPNAFTPNGDGINDIWDIKNINSYANATIKIYNRYGQIVYSSKGYPQPWNGRSNNQDLPVGIYYYLIDTNENGKVISGYVTIIR